MKTLFALFLLLTLTNAFAISSYYPTEFNTQVNKGTLKDDALKDTLFKILSLKHQKNANGGADTVGCSSSDASVCYGQTVLGYDGARKILFGKLFLKTDSSGSYISDVYCQKRFGGSAGVGAGRIPDGTKINCEHTWPQSRFTGAFPNEMQKSDLHHLYPTDSRANSIRGNDEFVDVASDNGQLSNTNCSASKYGSSSASSNDGFEPPATHRGNVARSLFYFSIRYKIAISKNEQEVLRRWSDLDPVDQEEMDRNDAIYAVQGNRNPFIDYPNLANDISKF